PLSQATSRSWGIRRWRPSLIIGHHPCLRTVSEAPCGVRPSSAARLRRALRAPRLPGTTWSCQVTQPGRDRRADLVRRVFLDEVQAPDLNLALGRPAAAVI